MKGEKFVTMLNNHAHVINAHARQLDRHQATLAALVTRDNAREQVLTASRFSMLVVGLREVFLPGTYKKAVDAAQKALLAASEGPKPASPEKGK